MGFLDLDDQGWRRGAKSAHDDMRRLRDDIDSISGPTNKMATGFLSLANTLSTIPTALQAVSGTVSLLGQMSGALGLIPAAGAGAVAAVATLKLGVQGFGDALDNAGDPAAFAESLETLSPAARASAIAVRDLRDEWETMQNSVQQDLFQGLAKHINALGARYLPVLDTGMSGIAAEFNYAAQTSAKFLAQSGQVSTVAGVFRSTQLTVRNLVADGMQPLLSILLDVVAVGSTMLPGLTSGFGDAAQRAAEFVHHARETGQLREWISGGLQAVGKLVQLLRNLGSIAGSIVTGLDAGGDSLIDTLITVTGVVKDWLKSFEGQETLHALGQALATVSTVVTGVLLTALQELGPVIVELAPGFADLARQVGGVLVTALRIAGPLLQGLAGFLSDNIDWLGPLAIALYGGVQAFQAVIGVIRVMSLLAATNPWLLLIGATVALVTLIITHWDQIKAAIAAAWDWIKNTAAWVWDKIKQFIINPITTAAQWISDKIGGIAQWFIDLPGRIAGALAGLVETITKPFREAFDAVLNQWNKLMGNINGTITGGANIGQQIATRTGQAGRSGGHAFRAHGGPVMANRSYWVGERGQRELFTPGADGFITPLDKMNGDGERALVQIGTFNATPAQSPHDIAFELDWASRGAGY